MTEPTEKEYRARLIEAINEIANSEVGGSVRIRWLILALVASNWVTIWMMFMYVTDLIPAREAARMAFFTTGFLFAMYFIVSRLPIIARNILMLGDFRD